VGFLCVIHFRTRQGCAQLPLALFPFVLEVRDSCSWNLSFGSYIELLDFLTRTFDFRPMQTSRFLRFSLCFPVTPLNSLLLGPARFLTFEPLLWVSRHLCDPNLSPSPLSMSPLSPFSVVPFNGRSLVSGSFFSSRSQSLP